MTKDEAKDLGVPAENLRQFQTLYHRDLGKAVERTASAETDAIRNAIMAMLTHGAAQGIGAFRQRPRKLPGYYRPCPACGANLDPGEPCSECKKNAAPGATNTEDGTVSHKADQNNPIIGENERNVK